MNELLVRSLGLQHSRILPFKNTKNSMKTVIHQIKQIIAYAVMSLWHIFMPKKMIQWQKKTSSHQVDFKYVATLNFKGCTEELPFNKARSPNRKINNRDATIKMSVCSEPVVTTDLQRLSMIMINEIGDIGFTFWRLALYSWWAIVAGMTHNHP
jgi:hypothetical protein